MTYKIIRTDLHPDQNSLQKTFDYWKENGVFENSLKNYLESGYIEEILEEKLANKEEEKPKSKKVENDKQN